MCDTLATVLYNNCIKDQEPKLKKHFENDWSKIGWKVHDKSGKFCLVIESNKVEANIDSLVMFRVGPSNRKAEA